MQREGQGEGQRAALQMALRVNLRRRGWPLDAAQEAHIQACHDPATLLEWIGRAVDVATLDAVFDTPEEGRGG